MAGDKLHNVNLVEEVEEGLYDGGPSHVQGLVRPVALLYYKMS